MASIRVVIADDHPVVRTGIRNLLEKASDIEVVGEAHNGAEALQLVVELAPDVLLLDMELAVIGGVAVAKQLREEANPVRVLGLSAYDDEQFIIGLVASGAAGYLMKDEAVENIVEAVRGVASGQDAWLSRRVMAKLLKQHRDTARPIHHDDVLSERERQVLTLLARGQSNAEIAERLGISDGTVRNHVTNIYAKLGVHTRAEAVAWAWQNGLVDGYSAAS